MLSSSALSSAGREDAELVARSIAGDRESFGKIVARYQSLICSLAYSATGSLSQSEDLGQETFLAAWKQLTELREPGKLRSWLCGIARNLIRNSLRREGREPSHAAVPLEEITESPAREPLPADQAISKEEEAILWRSLNQIPEMYREPLVLFYREHHSAARVAEVLDLSEDAVHQRLTRGRRLLQEQVLAFVEGALERSQPGRGFTLQVVASLPWVTAVSKSLEVAESAETFMKGALKLMAWTKTKTAILVGVAAITVTTSSVVGIKLAEARHARNTSSGLSPARMNEVFSIAKDGSVRLEVMLEETNLTSRTITTDHIGDMDTGLQITDASGRPMKHKKLLGGGSLVTLNQAVPPAGTVAYRIDGALGRVFKLNPSGAYEFSTTQVQGNEQELQLVEVWRLPPGGILVDFSPAEMVPSTNNSGQVELRLEKVVPPMGETPLLVSYRLDGRAN